MSHYGIYDGMAINSSRRPSFGSDFSGEAIGEIDSDGEIHWYRQLQHSGQHRHICKEHRQQPRHYSPPSPPRSRSRYEDDADYADMTWSMGGLSVSDYGSRTSRSRSVRSRPPLPPRAPSPLPAVRDFKYEPLASARPQHDDAYSGDGEEYVPAPPSRSRGRGRGGPPPTRQPQRQYEPGPDSDYDQPPRAAPRRNTGGYGGGQTTADIRAELAELEAQQAALKPCLYKVAGQGGSGGGKRVKGARTAAWVGKFVAGI